jgi:transposase InsO family protein
MVSWNNGLPNQKVFFADNGTEFKKSTLEDLSRRLGIRFELSPSYSPWSNGGNERRHGAVNLTLKKLMEDDSSLCLEEVLQHAVWARNMEIGRNGQSPYQVVLGNSPSQPGITDGNAGTNSLICESDILRLHFDRQEKVRVLFRQADCSRRLKEAEKVRLQPYHDQKYERGDEIIFLDKNDQWSGPAVV